MSDAPKPEPNGSTLDWVCNASEQEIAIALDSARAERDAAIARADRADRMMRSVHKAGCACLGEHDVCDCGWRDASLRAEKADRDAANARSELVQYIAANPAEERADQAEARAEKAERESAMLVEGLYNVQAERDRLAAENARLQSELAALSSDSLDADVYCWGPGYTSPEHAAPYAHRLRVLSQPGAERSQAGWKLLDENARMRKALQEIAGHCEPRVHSPPVRWILDVAQSALDAGKEPP
jgi:hypothetical protein